MSRRTGRLISVGDDDRRHGLHVTRWLSSIPDGDFRGGAGGWKRVIWFGVSFSHVTVEVPGDGGAGTGQPGILDGSFSVFVLIFQLAEVEVDLLWSGRFTTTSFQPVDGDRQGAGLSTPVALWVDGPQCGSNHPGDFVRPSQRNCEFPVGRGSSREEPHSLTRLDGVLLVAVSSGSPLESSP